MSYIPGISPARSWRKINRFDLLLAVTSLAAVLWFVWQALATAEYTWNWGTVFHYVLSWNPQDGWKAGMLLKGLATSLRLGVWSMLLALLIGGLTGTLSAHQHGLAALPFRLYVQSIRNMPPLVLLFLVFFFAGSFFTEPLLHVENWLQTLPALPRQLAYTLFAPAGQLDRMVAAVLTLGLYEGAYVTEIVRAGIESVPSCQWEASAAQGMAPWQQRLYVIAPQAIRLMLPPMGGQTISTFKDGSIASIISLPELTFQSLEIMAVSRITLELWLTVAALYLVVSWALARIGLWLETRQRWRPLQ